MDFDLVKQQAARAEIQKNAAVAQNDELNATGKVSVNSEATKQESGKIGKPKTKKPTKSSKS